ncbi:putative rRNA maturation factor [Candidatus Photodesmus blepharus]|uniref:Endoribonuclease YbeY n=1 Tax=Candidatus Photodesmus blepharonis TaxID=1179155 RepID=A0A084CPJ7_9GAMM|nr:rRNA maturation RNase YbeY [Candidatus Photodesmus blepharus]KEY91726.1 putative rRNA maturation factor [Candidatus Photodesmus blepharus]
MTIKLNLQFSTKDKNNLPSKKNIHRWLTLSLMRFQKQAEVTVRIVDKKESQQLNYKYRKKNKPTNVLSFPFISPVNMKLNLLGDLIICRQIVEQEAIKQNKPLIEHWAHMIIHGSLHLLGYDHIEKNEADEMESLEIEIMQNMGYKDPYFLEII